MIVFSEKVSTFKPSEVFLCCEVCVSKCAAIDIDAVLYSVKNKDFIIFHNSTNCMFENLNLLCIWIPFMWCSI